MSERAAIGEVERLHDGVLDDAGARVLVNVAAALLSTLEVDEVVARVAWGARMLLRSPRVAILAHEPATATLSGVTALGFPEAKIRQLRVRLSESATAELAVLDGRAQHSVEADDDSGLLTGLGFDAFACIPLRTREELLAVVVVDVAPERFGPEERELATQFGSLASIALENARLHRRARLPAALAQASRAAQELHDTVLQALFAIGVEADGLPAETPRAEQGLRLIVELANAAARDMRAAIQVLRGGKHLLLGLGPALEELAAASRRRTGLEIELAVAPYLREANDEVADVLYRVCREGLANVERHAQASRCRVSCTVENGGARAVVEDDGVGTDGAAENGHFGLTFLREAVEALGGSLELHAADGGGAALSARLPLDLTPASEL